MKIYGETKTNLRMTKAAEEVYNNSDPLVIKEYETDDGFRYKLEGIIERDDLTAEDVNRLLEEYRKEYWE